MKGTAGKVFKELEDIYKEARLKKEGWELDLFSTFLSRKHSYHKVVGKKHYVKLKRKEKEND